MTRFPTVNMPFFSGALLASAAPTPNVIALGNVRSFDGTGARIGDVDAIVIQDGLISDEPPPAAAKLIDR